MGVHVMRTETEHQPLDPLLIYGGGGHCKAVIDLARALGKYRIVGILDDHLPVGDDVLGVPVLGGSEKLPEIYASGVLLAANSVGGIGNYRVRLNVFEWLAQAGYTCPALIHPAAFVEPSASIAEGVQVLPTAYIGSAAQLGFGTIINAGAIISHDCKIGRVANISPGAMLAGGVTIEDYAQVGMGVTINLNITIGSQARVGNGATVKADVPAGGRVYAGMIWPARIGTQS